MDVEGNIERMESVDLDLDDELDSLPIGDLNDEIDCLPGKPEIEWNRVHAKPSSKETYGKLCFIPRQKIIVDIIHIEQTRDFQLNPYLYTIQLQHGNYTWKIRRRYKHFRQVHDALSLLRIKAQVSSVVPTIANRERRQSVEIGKKTVPKFPIIHDRLVPSNKVEARKKKLEEYLSAVLQIPIYRQHVEVLEFLEVCHLSFVKGIGDKLQEGMIEKRSGGRLISLSCCDCGSCLCCPRWHDRWLLVKDTFVAYIRPGDFVISDVLFMDKDFEVRKGKSEERGLHISNMTRHLYLKCSTDKNADDFYESIKQASESTGKEFIAKNELDSFAPLRKSSPAKWFADGGDYMSALADAMESAEEEIFIADWWLSPEVYLKRPITQDHKWRLDVLLKRKAECGIKIFVQLFKEVKQALGINSYYTKETLLKLHPENIKVLRHPDGITLWSHHEKCVVVDQRIAFLGGIDICYGRWDTSSHRLTDLGSYEPDEIQKADKENKEEEAAEKEEEHRPLGQWKSEEGHRTTHTEYKRSLSAPSPRENAKLSPVSQKLETVNESTVIANLAALTPESERKLENQTSTDSIARRQKFSRQKRIEDEGDNNNSPTVKFTPDIAARRKAPKLRVAAKHTAFVDSDSQEPVEKPETPKLHRKFVQAALDWKDRFHKRRLSSIDLSGAKVDFGQSIFINDDDLDEDSDDGSRLWIGKDYTNFIFKDFIDLNKPFNDFIDRRKTPRMPWHDIGCSVYGRAARDLILPKSYTKLSVPKHLVKGANIVDVQVLRSASEWSVGISAVECSIHNAYIKLIREAEHFIYIENQFFVSIADDMDVNNRIADALFQRIRQAHEKKETFRVYVIMPLLPGFEGEFGTSTGTSIQAVTDWNYKSICRGSNSESSNSIIQRIMQLGADPSEYISFFGLRTHGKLDDKLVTELIYVHSKLMIVDDKAAIIGSANINDRSMLGKRDSELAVMIRDINFFDSKMNGQPYRSGNYCGRLRLALFKEHLGENNYSLLIDPVSEEFYKCFWLKRASVNSNIFEKIFNCIPSNKATSFSNMKAMQSEEQLFLKDPEESEELIKKIHGHLVLLPYFFLKDEVLAPSLTKKEAFIPTNTWT
ncbi:DgyrCDS7620 [Dimorphilus gyrociliatus]|uniref:Phospholipase n=1 Tax=Dimorphilus gyrociliatus TaxID=2664684 RepID=A0A7I8VSJ1_9ANNE|nr:DgyrCDS7620 [Dimorphilus gyrociliatus]